MQIDSLEQVTARWRELLFRRVDEVGLQDLCPLERDLFHMFWLRLEVDHGGFQQYFFNSAGNHSTASVRALTRSNATRTRSLLLAAMAVFPEGVSHPDLDQRRDQLEALPLWEYQQLARLDQDFYRCPEDLDSLMVAYVTSEQCRSLSKLPNPATLNTSGDIGAPNSFGSR
jgi:hypothetical protein